MVLLCECNGIGVPGRGAEGEIENITHGFNQFTGGKKRVHITTTPGFPQTPSRHSSLETPYSLCSDK